MAISNSNLERLEEYKKEIATAINHGHEGENDIGLFSCWNTFQYVARELNEWAEETAIGTELKQDLTSNSGQLIATIDNTFLLTKILEDYIIRQRDINRGGSSSPAQTIGTREVAPKNPALSGTYR